MWDNSRIKNTIDFMQKFLGIDLVTADSAITGIEKI